MNKRLIAHPDEITMLDYIFKEKKFSQKETEDIIFHLSHCEYCRMKMKSLKNSFTIDSETTENNSDLVNKIIKKHQMSTEHSSFSKKQFTKKMLIIPVSVAAAVFFIYLIINWSLVFRPQYKDHSLQVTITWQQMITEESSLRSTRDTVYMMLEKTISLPSKNFLNIKKYLETLDHEYLQQFLIDCHEISQKDSGLYFQIKKIHDVEIDQILLNQILYQKNFNTKLQIRISQDSILKIFPK